MRISLVQAVRVENDKYVTNRFNPRVKGWLEGVAKVEAQNVVRNPREELTALVKDEAPTPPAPPSLKTRSVLFGLRTCDLAWQVIPWQGWLGP